MMSMKINIEKLIEICEAADQREWRGVKGEERIVNTDGTTIAEFPFSIYGNYRNKDFVSAFCPANVLPILEELKQLRKNVDLLKLWDNDEDVE